MSTLATFYSSRPRIASDKVQRATGARAIVVAVLVLGIIASGLGIRTLSGADLSEPSSPARRAEQAFLAVRIQFESAKTNVAVACQFGRAAFDWAEFAKKDADRAAIAEQGIDACRQAIARKPDTAAAHYYLALNLGQLARTKRLRALHLVTELETALLKAKQLDPHYDFAGPDRALGLLYLEAPGWPISIGNREKAAIHLLKAAELAPDFPENQLILAEAYLKWKNPAALRRQIETIERLWPKAKQSFVGLEWEEEWLDWTRRWERLR